MDKIAKSLMATSRSNRPEVLCKKGVLRNFTKFTGNHLLKAKHTPSNFLKAVFHKFYLVHF